MASDIDGRLVRKLLVIRPLTVYQLKGWVKVVLGFDVPCGGICDGHCGPLGYLAHVFFEWEGDVVVWANRGGGKTFYGAMATMLDMVFKPGIEVRLLGGSFEQSEKMYGYLREMMDRPGLREMVSGKITRGGFELVNGSNVELLAGSEKSVRGNRVQKLRCDEVELFDRDVWGAAQFVTRGKMCGDVAVRGSVEAFGTMHRAFGLMNELVGRKEKCVFKWCVLDVMSGCDDERECEGCRLWVDCKGRCRNGDGFVSIEDVLAQQGRSSRELFESEMLCRRPSKRDVVYGGFNVERHVRKVVVDVGLRHIGGVDFGLRSPFVMLWAQVREVYGGGRVVEVYDEYVATEKTIDEHVKEMKRRGWPGVEWLGVDPAGNQRSEQSGVSSVAVLRKHGYSVRSRRGLVMDGVEMVRCALVNGDGDVGLVIDGRCTKLIESMSCYHFDVEHQGREQPVKDGYDHAVDALRYMMMNLDRSWAKVEVREY